MHASLLLTAIALAGQLTANDGGGRYADPGNESVPPAGTNTPTAQQLWNENSPPLVTPNGSAPIDTGNYGGQAQPTGSQPMQDTNRGFDTGVTPLQTETAPPSQLKPSQLLRTMLQEPLQGKLVGVPQTLANVLQGAPSRSEQTRRIESYWNLTAAVAQYNSALQDSIRFKTLQVSVAQPGPQWEQERQLIESQVQISGRTAKVAQHRLQRLLGRSDSGPLPLPSDLPHCGAYDTRYNEIFAGQSSKQAGQLNKFLSLKYESLQNEATSVAAANQWLQTVSQTRNPNTDGRGLLKAHELLTLRRRAFIDNVRDYNVNIARYAEISTPGDVSTDRLMAMLISTTAQQRQNWARQGIQRASAEQPIGNRTFAPGNPSQTRRAHTPQNGLEHSILTRPGSDSR